MPDATRARPREPIIRAITPGAADFTVRDSADGTPTLVGHFARFNEWTEIESAFEGHFMERIAPGAFKKTFAERGSSIKVLFQHGRDPEIGDKAIAIPTLLREEPDAGAYYEADLLEGIPPLVMSGLRRNAYGASFRFRIIKESTVEDPEASEHNPRGLPERTIQEVDVAEFGPVTFPAYSNATAGVRSMTDAYLRSRVGTGWALDEPSTALSDDGAGDDHSDGESRDPVQPSDGDQPAEAEPRREVTVEEYLASFDRDFLASFRQ